MKELLKIKLGELVDFQTGPFGTQFSASEYVNEGIPVINVKNIGIGTVIRENLDYISEQTRDRLSQHILKTGDIVFGRKGSVDRHAYIFQNENGWVQGSDCIRARKKTQVNTLFLSQYLEGNGVKKQIINAAVGSTMPSLNTDILKDVIVLLPNIEEQNRISEALKKIDDKICLNSKINDNLEQQAKLLYDYWFTQFDFPDKSGKPYRSSGGKMVWNEQLKRTVPDGWTTNPLSDILTFKSGYSFSSDLYEVSGKYKLLTIKNVQNNGINLNVDNYINVLPDNVPDYCLLKAKDILMSLTGNVGRVGIMYADNCLLNQRVALAEPVNINQRVFVYFLLKSDIIHKQYEMIANGSSQQNLSPIEAEKVIIAYNSEVATKFSTLCSEYLNTIVSNLAENQELINMRDWLLPMLMNGQATISD